MTEPRSPAEQALRDAAFEYHRAPRHGKISITPTKPLMNQRDLSLAHSPGVAYPCLAIEENPALAADVTSRGNLVGVITNGTAVLGLGDIGPLASKPVMEGKACRFKKFAGIDVFDIELAERDPDKLVEIISALEHVRGVIGMAPGVNTLAAMNALMLEEHTLFITDTFVNEEPTAVELAAIVHMAAIEVQRFGVPLKVAFLSHSMYGSSTRASAKRMRAARDLFVKLAPDVECDGEMQGDAALSESIRLTVLPSSKVTGAANVLVLPNLDAANILFSAAL